MTVLDYFVLFVVAASIILGASRGILKGIISVISTIAGLIAAAHLYEYAAVVFGGVATTPRAANLLGFVGVFLLFLIAGGLASRWLQRRLKRARLRWLDRMFGAAFGLARGWLVCSAIYLALTAFPVRLETVERAMFAPVLLEGTRVISYLASSELRERFLNGYTTVQGLWESRG
ncbi:MAG TPA: CvpA family protein [Blastocatellia bacterium]|jgi:membrane protein required for colicin V production|nr:CvpA family protein [Blastocatellia bacterium]